MKAFTASSVHDLHRSGSRPEFDEPKLRPNSRRWQQWLDDSPGTDNVSKQVQTQSIGSEQLTRKRRAARRATRCPISLDRLADRQPASGATLPAWCVLRSSSVRWSI